MDAVLPIEGLRREHLRMREVAGLIGMQLDRLEVGGQVDFLLAANALSYMSAFPSQVHHPKEDAIFERLSARDPTFQSLVDGIREEHLQIYEMEARLKDMALRRPLSATSQSRRFISFGREYLRLQRDHSITEDAVLFPRAIEVLRADDWDRVAATVQELDDPLFGPAPREEFQFLYEQLKRNSARA